MDGYGVTIIALFGIGLNIIGVFDLLRKKKRKRFFNLLLATQFFFNLLLLTTYFIKSLITHFVTIPHEYFSFYPFFVCPVLRWSLSCSILMTVTLAYSRCNALENPILHRDSLYTQADRLKDLMKHISPLIILSIPITLPWFLEFEVESVDETENRTPSLFASHIRLDPIYSLTYIVIFSLVCLVVFPTVALTYLSIRIYKAINKDLTLSQIRVVRSPVTRSVSANTQSFNKKCPNNKIVIMIVIFFLIFSIPRVVFTVAEVVIQILRLNKPKYEIGCSTEYWLGIVGIVNKLFTVINSSIHVFLYKSATKFIVKCFNKNVAASV